MDNSQQNKSVAVLMKSRPASRYDNQQSDGEEPPQKPVPLEAPKKSDSLRNSEKNFRVASDGLNLDPKNLKFYQVAPLIKIRSNLQTRWAWCNESMPVLIKEGRLRIMFITWNMGGKGPQESIEEVFNTMLVKPHIYVVATQECCHSILTSFIFNSKSAWKKKINTLLGRDYHETACVSMNAMNLSIYCHTQIYPYVNSIQSDTVKTGLMGILGNKGGIAITFKIGEFSILVIGAHLAAGKKSAEKRNADFEKIKKSLKIPIEASGKTDAGMPLGKRCDLVCLLGDLNYRINENHIENTGLIKSLLEKCELSSLMSSGGPTYTTFVEAPITFLPTYRFLKDKNEYDFRRTPSYTDRILFTGIKRDRLSVSNYEANTDVNWGDHKPVFAQTEIGGIVLEKDKTYEKNETSHCTLI